MRVSRILLAEDNDADVFLVRQALEEHRVKHELHVVQDGAEAISYVSRMGEHGTVCCPDLMLLDLNLPSADGPQILAAFRKNPQCAKTPVIIVTSSDAPRDRARVSDLGISHYFKKPSDWDEFMELGAVVLKTLSERAA